MAEHAYDVEALADELVRVTGEGRVLRDEPMAPHTTFRIGGPADLFVTPSSAEEVAAALSAVRAAGAPAYVVGNGSNLLVDDAGLRGVVVCTAEALRGTAVDGRVMTCDAGVSLREASEAACERGLSGLEFACGIPGTVGGAVFMNAGAYDGQVSDVLVSALVLDAEGRVSELAASELALGYRTSRVRTDGLVCLRATFELAEGDRAAIRARMDELTARREDKQPLDMPSAGSTFKRPEGHFAGKLITDAGLKGCRVGGAQVSEKHAGFVVNAGGATAADVRALIAHVQDEVERRFGVRLEPEVRMLP